MSRASALDFEPAELQHGQITAQPSTLFEDAEDDLPILAPALPHTGCRGLLVALLQDLFQTQQQLRRRKPGYFYGRAQLARDVAWVASEDTDPFSFRWVCEHLGLDPAQVRRRYAE
jgi:hypothetical protein